MKKSTTKRTGKMKSKTKQKSKQKPKYKPKYKAEIVPIEKPPMIANTVLMVRPVRFGYNEETAATNSFQNRITQLSNKQIQEIARLEFDAFVEELRKWGIIVLDYDDERYPYTPDSIFPNNWFSTCPHTKTIYTYPMCNANRADERREDIIKDLSGRSEYKVNNTLVKFEQERKYLEGTGSLVLDHQNKIAYAAISPRTHVKVLEKWSKLTGFEVVYFTAYGPQNDQIYHTNVMMCVADEYVVICLDTIANKAERKEVINSIEESGKTIINITTAQMSDAFAGNMLQLATKRGQKYLVMSSRAEQSLTEKQLKTITKTFDNKIIGVPINIIESVGGGSARCMMAEVFS